MENHLRAAMLTCLAVAGVLFGPTADVSYAQLDHGIRVVPTITSPVSVMPGEIATTGIRISSSSDQVVRCLAFVDLPEGWRRIVGEQGFDVIPGKEEVRLVSVAVPGRAPSGPYTVSYILRAADTGAEIHRAGVTINVRSSLRVGVAVSHAPRNAVAGLPYVATFEITNSSNETGRVRFRLRSIPDLPAIADSTSVVLMPFEKCDVHVTVTTDDASTIPFRHALEMQAWLEADSTVVSEATALVQVLPRTTFEGDRITIPFQFTVRNTGENGKSGSQIELFSIGSFAGDNPNHYELLLRGPDNRTQSLLGRRDEYRVAYENSGNEVIVGDQAFRLTPLTELGHYAFGASGKARMDRWQAGAFVNESRWSPARANEAAAFASFDAARDISVGVNYLHKAETRTSDILTLQGELALLDQADLAMEVGGSESPGEKGKGIGFELRSRPSWIQYGINVIYAEPGFSGYYRDFDAKAANFSVFPVDQLRFEGYYRNEKRGLDRDPALLHAPQNEEIQAGVGYGGAVAAYLKFVRYRDMLPDPKYDRRENTFVLHLGANFQAGSVFATVDVGTTEELLLQRSYPLRRISLSSRFQPSPSQGYSVSLEYGSTKDLFTDLSREGTSWSLSAWYRLSASLQVQASVYQSWTIAPFRQMNTLGDATLEYTLPFEHRISLMGRINSITSSFNADNVAYSVEYTVPFDISFSGATAGGRLAGRVVDLESGLGLSDLILYAGEQVAITDRSGKFEFPNLRVGTYDISIDRGIIGPDRIPSEVLPTGVQIVEGLDRVLEIGIVQSGTISGNVIGHRESPAVTDGSGATPEVISGVTVEIRSASEIFRRVTDERGRFNFRDLRPGTWTITVLPDDLPEELRSAASPRSVGLSPGQTIETDVVLTTARRRIRMLQEGTLLKLQRPVIR